MWKYCLAFLIFSGHLTFRRKWEGISYFKKQKTTAEKACVDCCDTMVLHCSLHCRTVSNQKKDVSLCPTAVDAWTHSSASIVLLGTVIVALFSAWVYWFVGGTIKEGKKTKRRGRVLVSVCVDSHRQIGSGYSASETAFSVHMAWLLGYFFTLTLILVPLILNTKAF